MISGVNGDFQIYFLLNIMGIFFTVHAGKKVSSPAKYSPEKTTLPF